MQFMLSVGGSVLIREIMPLFPHSGILLLCCLCLMYGCIIHFLSPVLLNTPSSLAFFRCPFCNFPALLDKDMSLFSCPNPRCRKVSPSVYLYSSWNTLRVLGSQAVALLMFIVFTVNMFTVKCGLMLWLWQSMLHHTEIETGQDGRNNSVFWWQ